MCSAHQDSYPIHLRRSTSSTTRGIRDSLKNHETKCIKRTNLKQDLLLYLFKILHVSSCCFPNTQRLQQASQSHLKASEKRKREPRVQITFDWKTRSVPVADSEKHQQLLTLKNTKCWWHATFSCFCLNSFRCKFSESHTKKLRHCERSPYGTRTRCRRICR